MLAILLFAFLAVASGENEAVCSPEVQTVEEYDPWPYDMPDIVEQLAIKDFSDKCNLADLLGDYSVCQDYLLSTDINTNSFFFTPAIGIIVSIICIILFICRFCCCDCLPPRPARSKNLIKVVILVMLGAMVFSSSYSFSGFGHLSDSLKNVQQTTTVVVANVEKLDSTLAALNTSSQLVVQASEQFMGTAPGVDEEGACAVKVPDSAPDPVVAQALVDTVNAESRAIGEQLQSISLDTEPFQPISDGMHLMSGYMELLDDQIKVVAVGFEEQGENAQIAFVCFYIVLSILVVLGMIMPMHKPCFFTVYSVGIILIFFTALLSGIALATSKVIVSTLCYPSPTELLGEAFDTMGESIAGHYITCKGENPFAENYGESFETMLNATSEGCEIVNAKGTGDLFNDEVLVSTQACEDAITNLTTGLNGVQTQLIAVKDMITCRVLNEPVTLMFQEAICTNLAQGLRSIFAAQIGACLCLYVALYLMPFLERLDKEEEKQEKYNKEELELE